MRSISRTFSRGLHLGLLALLLAVSGVSTAAPPPDAPGDHVSVTAEVAQAAPDRDTPVEPSGALSLLAAALATLAVAGFMGTIRAGTSMAGGALYRPALHSPEEAVPTRIDPSSFKSSDWVDADGVLKPGTPLAADGALADGTIVEDVMTAPAARVVPFAVGIAEGSTDALLDAAPNGDVAACTRGDISRDHVEGNLGRVLTTAEVAAIEASGRFVLV